MLGVLKEKSGHVVTEADSVLWDKIVVNVEAIPKGSFAAYGYWYIED